MKEITSCPTGIHPLLGWTAYPWSIWCLLIKAELEMVPQIKPSGVQTIENQLKPQCLRLEAENTQAPFNKKHQLRKSTEEQKMRKHVWTAASRCVNDARPHHPRLSWNVNLSDMFEDGPPLRGRRDCDLHIHKLFGVHETSPKKPVAYKSQANFV